MDLLLCGSSAETWDVKSKFHCLIYLRRLIYIAFYMTFYPRDFKYVGLAVDQLSGIKLGINRASKIDHQTSLGTFSNIPDFPP